MNRPLPRLAVRAFSQIIATMALVALAGCQSTSAPFDPFLAGRTTIAPPATAIPAGPAPYYSTQPPTVAVPGGQTTIYTPPGAIPAAVPVTPVPSDGSGRFPRGVSLPQSNNSSPDRDTQVAVAQPPSATATESAAADRRVAPSEVINSLATPVRESGVVQASHSEPAVDSQIRIVEPLNIATAQAPPAFRKPPAPPGDTTPQSNSRLGQPSVISPRAATEPSPRRLPELTDFPVLTNAVPREMPGYGFDPRYAWLKGKLEYSPSQKRWKLRYIAVEGPTDDFGGSVILSDADKLKGFEPGDFVRIQGRVSESSGAAKGFSPAYSIDRITKQNAAKSPASPAG